MNRASLGRELLDRASWTRTTLKFWLKIFTWHMRSYDLQAHDLDITRELLDPASSARKRYFQSHNHWQNICDKL